MLKTPVSLHTCSSSPMRSRLGSAERVVLPVPGETEKESDVAVLDADIGRRVEGELAKLDGLEGSA